MRWRSDDRAIWRSFRHHSRTFSLAARLLPRAVQLPVASLYLYCRTVDTLADERILEIGAERALEELATLRHALERTLAGDPPPDRLWRRLADVHERFELHAPPLFELIEGAEWDLRGRPLLDLEDLVQYSDYVGGSIGAMMLPFLLDDRAQLPHLECTARALGIAMQITNILRDVGEDRRTLGRLYLPRDGMARFALDPSDLDGEPSEAYGDFLEALMLRAEELYEQGFQGVEGLPLRVQPAIRAAARMYRDLLNEVRQRGYDNLTQRAFVPLSRKLVLLLWDDYAARKESLLGARHRPALA